MADLRISQLPELSTVAETDVFPFTDVSENTTSKIEAKDLGVALVELGLSVGTQAPSAAYEGQPWVDTTPDPPVLKVYNGAGFTTVSFLPGSSVATSPGTTGPSGNPVPTGKLWLDTSQDPVQLKVYNGTDFVRVDPLGITQTAGDARYLQSTDASSTYLALAGGTLTGDLTLNGDPSTTNQAANKNYVDTQIAAIPTVDPVPAGTVIWTARDSAPDGYLEADGSAVSRTGDTEALFEAIGTRYGAGDGSTTFNLPDLRGQFVRGIDEVPGSNNPRGKDSGRQLGSDQGDQNKQHNHTLQGGSLTYVDSVTLNKNTNEVPNSPDEVNVLNNNTTITVSTSSYVLPTVNNDGGTEARPTNIALLGCIKY